MGGRFAGSVALVTGAAGGIGAGVVRRLAEEGAHVAVADLSRSGVETLADEIRATGGAASAHWLDVTQPEDVARVLDEIEAGKGPVTHAVHCAGIDKQAAFLEMSPEDWDRTIDVNLKGTFLVLQAVARRLVAHQAPGHIVAVASVAGRRPNPTQADYGASKAGVINLVRSAGVALAPHGIVVNAVCPGVIDTAMTSSLHEERARILGITPDTSLQSLLGTIPIGRMGAVEEVVDVVTFLLSEDARYMVGQAINVCGGLAFD